MKRRNLFITFVVVIFSGFWIFKDFNRKNWNIKSTDIFINGSETKIQKLPEAIIIGEAKCGTGALIEYIEMHPDAKAPPNTLEVKFFTKYYEKGINSATVIKYILH